MEFYLECINLLCQGFPLRKLRKYHILTLLRINLEKFILYFLNAVLIAKDLLKF